MVYRKGEPTCRAVVQKDWSDYRFFFLLFLQDQAEQVGNYTYPLSLYFTYVSLTTIGYGDVIPRSRAGRPVFVAWSLAAIPSVTLLISDIGDTLAKWVKEGPIESVIAKWLIGTVDISYENIDAKIRDQEEEEAEAEEEEEEERVTNEKPPVPDPDRDQGYKAEVRKALTLLGGVRKILHDDEKKRYTWEEWQGFLRLLELNRESGGSEEGDVSNWTWMGDEGPLFARGESEKLWILDHIRQKLFHKMEKLLK